MGFIRLITRNYKVPFFLMWVILFILLFSIGFIVIKVGFQDFTRATANLKYLANAEYCIFDDDCAFSNNSCYVINTYYKGVPGLSDRFNKNNNCQALTDEVACVKNKCQILP